MCSQSKAVIVGVSLGLAALVLALGLTGRLSGDDTAVFAALAGAAVAPLALLSVRKASCGRRRAGSDDAAELAVAETPGLDDDANPYRDPR